MDTLKQEKLFYERFYNLHNDKQLLSVFERFGIAAFRRSSVLEGFEQFMLQSIGFVGHTCVEIGTYNGLTALVLARYFDRVITFDVVEQPLRKHILEYLGVTNVEAVIVKNNEEKAQRIAALDFCAAYSDGDHTNDTVTDFNILKKCGCVMFHEHWDAQQSVLKLVASLGSVGHGVSTSGKFALWTV